MMKVSGDDDAPALAILSLLADSNSGLLESGRLAVTVLVTHLLRQGFAAQILFRTAYHGAMLMCAESCTTASY